MRLLLHGHQQGGRPPPPAPEAGLHNGRRVREVHPHPVLHHPRLQPQRQTDPLPLQEVSVRGAGALTDGGPQVQAPQRVERVELRSYLVPLTDLYAARYS